MKNVIAIAAGMCEGLGLGTNAMAALVTRGCNEMQRLALSLGAMPTTLTGNVGFCIQSDQVVTVWHRFVWLTAWLLACIPYLCGPFFAAAYCMLSCRALSSSDRVGLSGVGDTFGTCFGPLSRNRNLGVRLGKGDKLEDILASSTEVAEGVATAFSLVELIDKNHRSYVRALNYPIIYGVKEILDGKRTPREGLRDLMAMPIRAEMWNSQP